MPTEPLPPPIECEIPDEKNEEDDDNDDDQHTFVEPVAFVNEAGVTTNQARHLFSSSFKQAGASVPLFVLYHSWKSFVC